MTQLVKGPRMVRIDTRQELGRQIAAHCRIVQKNDQWVVPSQTGNGSYRVNLNPKPYVPMCTCPDFAERNKKCKHVYAVEFVVEREKNGGFEEIPVGVTVGRAVAERKTYKQNWRAYNTAQSNEKDRFQILLHDLCRGISEPVQTAGRPRMPLADMVFA